jgi:alpha-L-fucosidase
MKKKPISSNEECASFHSNAERSNEDIMTFRIRRLMAVAMFFAAFMISGLNVQAKDVAPPEPYGPTPSPRQLMWHEMEFYAFVHFTVNTFTDREWGEGTESESVFNPTQFDARQWVKTLKDAGMSGIIITAKHHDGFCLWPSKYTKHTVASSPWKNGGGDVLREVSDAAREYGVKFGVYLSPWDRHEPLYGSGDAYNDFYKKQLLEILTQYGDVFEVWFDGACGEGPNGKKQEYDWPGFIGTVRKYAPNAVIFSDAGPDIRWIGNESGLARETNWGRFNRDEYYPGTPYSADLTEGQSDGKYWVPTEIDVSIRPGWFYHSWQDNQVKSLDKLLDIYYSSVGMGGNLLLNVPPDRRGLINENDVRRLTELKKTLEATFATDFALNKKATASNVRGKSERYAAANVLDGNKDTYWASDDGVAQASLEIDLGAQTTFNVVRIDEHIALGQRVKSFALDYWTGSDWKQFAAGTTINAHRILKTDNIKSDKVRLRITDSFACPVINRVSLYFQPAIISAPTITRGADGVVSILKAPKAALSMEDMKNFGKEKKSSVVQAKNLEIFYTTDGTQPDKNSKKYVEPFALPDGGIVEAITVIKPGVEETSIGNNMSVAEFGMATSGWKSANASGGQPSKSFDGDDNTFWISDETKGGAPELVIDLGREVKASGFFYLPRQDGKADGIIDRFDFYISEDGINWGPPAASGLFDNIRNNPVLKKVRFKQPASGRFIRFVAKSTIQGPIACVAEIGIFSH